MTRSLSERWPRNPSESTVRAATVHESLGLSVQTAAASNDQIDAENRPTGLRLLAPDQLGERAHGLNSDLPGRDGGHGPWGFDELGRGRVGVADDSEIARDF